MWSALRTQGYRGLREKFSTWLRRDSSGSAGGSIIVIDQIPGFNIILDPHSGDKGVIDSIPVIAHPGGYLSQWQPTKEEREAIAAGAPVRLNVIGQYHPPVQIMVGPVPKYDA